MADRRMQAAPCNYVPEVDGGTAWEIGQRSTIGGENQHLAVCWLVVGQLAYFFAGQNADQANFVERRSHGEKAAVGREGQCLIGALSRLELAKALAGGHLAHSPRSNRAAKSQVAAIRRKGQARETQRAGGTTAGRRHLEGADLLAAGDIDQVQ